MAKSKWYAVANGRKPGIYRSWDECKAQTAGFSGAIFKSFKTRDEAEAFMSSHARTPAAPAAAVPSAAAATPSSKVPVGLTPEQRRRMEENRKRALRIRQMKMTTPSPSQQHQSDEVIDLTTQNDKKRARVPEPSSANKRPPRYPTNNDHDDIDYEDMEDSLRFQLDVAPIYGEPSSSGGGGSEKEATEVEIGDELQMKAIQLALDGKNMFLTGKAGTGKSWVTKKIVNKFIKLNKLIHVTAPTGIAAINVGGVTINSWGNYHLGNYYDDFDRMWEKSEGGSKDKIRKADALLIDEISMLDGHTFDCLECMISIVRYYNHHSISLMERTKKRVEKIKEDAGTKHTLSDTMLSLRWDEERGIGFIPPFGDMQLIVVGDFYQLAPVPNGIDVLLEGENLRETDYDLKIGRQGAYAFESVAWHKLGLHTIELQQVHRQADAGLLNFLNAMREGEKDLVSNYSDTLRHLQEPIIDYGDSIVPTELHSKNYVVDKRNRDEIEKLPGRTVGFAAIDDVDFDPDIKQRILKKYIHDKEDLAGLQGLHTLSLINSDKVPGNARQELQRDYKRLAEYAQETFFDKGCRVSNFYEMKEDAQVMLLWNLDLSQELANGSRGVINGFFPAEGYCYLVQEELLHRLNL